MASRAEQKKQLRAEREAAQKAEADAAARRKRTAYLAGGVGLIALIVVVALVLVSQSGDDKTVETADVFEGVPQKGITLGEANAPVTVVEFADLQCPFCRDFAVDDLPGIVDDYVKPGDVKMELRLLAFIDAQSSDGRNFAAGAAQQDLIWPFAEEVYNNQGTERSGYMTTDFATDYAAESDQEAEDEGVSSTPSFVVSTEGGDSQVVDASGLRDAIDDALAQSDSGK